MTPSLIERLERAQDWAGIPELLGDAAQALREARELLREFTECDDSLVMHPINCGHCEARAWLERYS